MKELHFIFHKNELCNTSRYNSFLYKTVAERYATKPMRYPLSI